jgi:hypothetical protein
MSSNKLDKSKELLRQGELRINGIIQFSKEIDDKVFKLLGASIGVASGLLFFILKTHSVLEECFLNTSIFAFILLCLSIVFLLLAGKPAPYKGVGLPLSEFDDEKSLEDILQNSKARYTERFKKNAELNENKTFWLEHAIYTLASLPIITSLFYLQSLFLPVVIVIISNLFIVGIFYIFFRQFVVK